MRAMSAQPTRIAILRERASKKFELLEEYKAVQTTARDMMDKAVDAKGRIDLKQRREARNYQREWEAQNAKKLTRFGIQKKPLPKPRKSGKELRMLERMD